MIDFEKILAVKGKTKAELARFLEIEPRNINRIIKNDRIDFSKVESICSFLEISIIDALRISGYDDTPGGIDSKEFLEIASEAISAEIMKLFRDKIIAPYSALEAKDKEIAKLNREIGRLEAKTGK